MTAQPFKPGHWTVQMNYRNRTASFVPAFLMMGSHLLSIDAQPWAWVLAVLQFLVSPHLMRWWAEQAADLFAAEIRNMLGEAVLFGVWCAALGFPIWITFVLWIGMAMNLAAFQGIKGFGKVACAIGAGAVPTWLWVQPDWHPDTSNTTTFVSIACVSVFLVLFARAAHRRTSQLAATREDLKSSRASLEATNLALHDKIQEIGKLQERLTLQVSQDEVTGLFNRQYLHTSLPRELSRCQRNDVPLSIIVIEIDDFARLRQQLGDGGWQDVLRQTSQLLTYHARQGDMVCRIDCNTFAMLLPGMSRAKAEERAGYVCRGFAQNMIWHEGKPVSTTASIGVSSHPENSSVNADLLEAAERAMSAARTAGGNQVRIAIPPALVSR